MTNRDLENIRARLETLQQLKNCDQVGGTILDGKTPLISVLPSDKYAMSYMAYTIISASFDIIALLDEVERLHQLESRINGMIENEILRYADDEEREACWLVDRCGHPSKLEDCDGCLRAVDHEWISVEERLPVSAGDYLTVESPTRTPHILYWDHELWREHEHGCGNNIVTHWRPMPEPPGGK